MDKKYRYVTRAILASAVAVPVFAASNVQAESYNWNTSRYIYSYYTPSYGYNNYNYNYGYNNYDYYYGYNN